MIEEGGQLLSLPNLLLSLPNSIADWVNRFLDKDRIVIHITHSIIDGNGERIVTMTENPKPGDTLTYPADSQKPLTSYLSANLDNRGARDLEIEKIVAVDSDGVEHSHMVNRVIKSRKQLGIDLEDGHLGNIDKVLVHSKNGRVFKKKIKD